MRAGSANVFYAGEPKVGRYIKGDDCRDGLEFSIFMTELAGYYASATKNVLVMDNLSTHSCEILQQHMGDDLAKKISDRFEIHYTSVMRVD